MVQQRGVKRAAKVAVRKKKLIEQTKLARVKKAIRAVTHPKVEEDSKE
jgi:hypothetical protein